MLGGLVNGAKIPRVIWRARAVLLSRILGVGPAAEADAVCDVSLCLSLPVIYVNRLLSSSCRLRLRLTSSLHEENNAEPGHAVVFSEFLHPGVDCRSICAKPNYADPDCDVQN